MQKQQLCQLIPQMKKGEDFWPDPELCQAGAEGCDQLRGEAGCDQEAVLQQVEPGLQLPEDDS